MKNKPLARALNELNMASSSKDLKLSDKELMEAIRQRLKLLDPSKFSTKKVKVK